MNYDNIGEFIKERRKTKGLTQKELANKLGVTDKAVSKWETGLGCPDVSILEILSKELDCSILELLKGREIVDEVIPITEADDYIKTGLRYGENNFKKIISKVIAAIVIFIVSILFLLNIVNMYNQREKIIYDSSVSTRITSKLDIINKNISIINKNRGKYSTDDYNVLVSLLDETKKEIEINPYINYDGNEVSKKDLYIMDISGLSYTKYFGIYRIIAKYDSNMEAKLNSHIESVATRMFLGNTMIQQTYNSIYKYQFLDGFPHLMNDFNQMNPIQARLYDIVYRLGLYVDITNAIIEVGDIHE